MTDAKVMNAQHFLSDPADIWAQYNDVIGPVSKS